MRTRNKSNSLTTITVGGITVQNRGLDTPYSTASALDYTVNYGSKVLSLDNEQMEDNLGKTGSSNRCFHLKTKANRTLYAVWEDYHSISKTFQQLSGIDAYVADFGDSMKFVGHNSVTTAFPPLKDLVNQAVASWYSGENEVDSLLNVIEAPELVSSIRGAAEYMQPDKIKSILSECRTHIPKYSAYYHGYKIYRKGKRSWKLDSPDYILDHMTKSPLKAFASIWTACASGFLAWSFAIAPLVADARKLQKSFRRAADQAKKFADKPNIRVIHRSRIGSFSKELALDTSLTGYTSKTDLQQGWWTAVVSAMRTPEVSVTVRGTAGHSLSSSSMREFDRLMSKFGVSGPATLAWELCPFSFVLNWFIDTSTLLGKIDSALTGGPKITDICYSYRWGALVQGYHIGNWVWVSTAGRSHIFNVELSYYLRDRYTGSTDLVFWQSRYGKRQRNLTIALASQQLGALRK